MKFGKHATLKMLWAEALVGSSPTPGTNKKIHDNSVGFLFSNYNRILR